VQTCRREAEKQHLIEESSTAVERIGAMIDTLDGHVRRIMLEAAHSCKREEVFMSTLLCARGQPMRNSPCWNEGQH